MFKTTWCSRAAMRKSPDGSRKAGRFASKRAVLSTLAHRKTEQVAADSA